MGGFMAVFSTFRRWSPPVAHLALACLLNTVLDVPSRAEALRQSRQHLLVSAERFSRPPALHPPELPATPSALPRQPSFRPAVVRGDSSRTFAPTPIPLPATAAGGAPELPMEASPSPAEQLAGLAPLPPLPSPEGASIPSLGGQPLAGAAPQESTGTAAPESLESAAEGIPLLPGWNLISLPKEPDSIDPATVFSSIPGALVAAHTYDGCNAADPWRVYAPGAAGVSDLSAVDHRIGVWVQAGGATTLAVSGVEPAETTLQLCEGWNLIGYPSSYPRPVLSALASIAGKFRWVLAYDPADAEDPWEAFDASAPTWANDLQIMRPGRGYWVYATENVSLRLSNTGPPPEVAIVSPADAATITAPTNVTGTVRSDLLESWTLEFRLQGESTFTSFASSNAPVTNAVLGSFDPTLLLNGMYEVRLTARDFAGKTASASINAVVGGQMKIGHFSLSFVDLDVPVAGLPIQVTRTYDSRDKRRGDFGIGWRLSLSD